MSWSHMVAAQDGKSAFVEISEQSAAAARLKQEAQQAQSERSPEEARFLTRQVISRWNRVLHRILSSVTPHPGEAQS